MGAWSTDNFGNDDALDFVGDLCSRGDEKLIGKALAAVANCGDAKYLEVPECSSALAAAELVAAAKGVPPRNLPDDAADWLDSHAPRLGSELVGLARRAVERVRTDSELKEHWEQNGTAEEWHQVLADLAKRLDSISA